MGEIVLRISKKKFSVKLEGEGFTGGECITEADALQAALGLHTITESPKDEMVFHVGQASVENQ